MKATNTNQDYRDWFRKNSVDALRMIIENDPSKNQRISRGLARAYNNDSDEFFRYFDFVAFEEHPLPLDPKDYTDENWEDISLDLEHVNFARAENAAFKSCPQSVDPREY